MNNQKPYPRKVKPYKGGRSDRLEIRIRPETKLLAKFIAKSRRCTVSDLIEYLITRYK